MKDRVMGLFLAAVLGTVTGAVMSKEPQQDLPEQLAGSAPHDGVGLLFWGQTREQRIADGAGIGIQYIRAIGPDAQKALQSVLVGEPDYPDSGAAALAPGTYDVQATCQTGRGFEFRNAQLSVSAGRRYLLRCLGRTRRSVRLQIDVF